MATLHQHKENDENNAVPKLEARKPIRAADAQRRPALGNLGNQQIDVMKKLGNSKPGLVDMATKKLSAVVKPLGDTTNKKIENGIKTYKNVKARVDSHWNKATATNAAQKQIITRSESRKSLDNGKLTTGLIRPQAIITQKNGLVRQSSVRVRVGELPRPQMPTMKAAPFIKSRPSPKKDVSVQMTETFMQTHSAKMLAQVENIDALDTENPQLVAEYVNDIYSYLHKLEREFPIRENYLEGHAEVSPKMRSILIDWINEVHLQFKLEIESFHMAVSVIDRYLQVALKVERSKLQLVGVTALFFATKYEELFPPAISDFVYICDDCYRQEEILEMERRLFKALKFNLSKPLPIHFLRRFSKAARSDDTQHLFSKYVMELASTDSSLVHYYPSEIAAASLYLALKVFPHAKKSTDESTWTPTLVFYSGYENIHLAPIVQRMAKLVLEAPNAKLKSVYSKYCSSKFDSIAKNSALGNGILEEIVNHR